MKTNSSRASDYTCPKCGQPYHFKQRRSWFVRAFLPFLPVKKLFCARCKKGRYVVIRNED